MKYTDLNCNLRGEYVMLEKKTAPISRRGCFNISGDYRRRIDISTIAPSGIKIKRF